MFWKQTHSLCLGKFTLWDLKRKIRRSEVRIPVLVQIFLLRSYKDVLARNFNFFIGFVFVLLPNRRVCVRKENDKLFYIEDSLVISDFQLPTINARSAMTVCDIAPCLQQQEKNYIVSHCIAFYSPSESLHFSGFNPKSGRNPEMCCGNSTRATQMFIYSGNQFSRETGKLLAMFVCVPCNCRW